MIHCLKPNTNYSVTARCKVAAGGSARLGVDWYDETKGIGVYTPTGNTTYQTVSRSFTTGPNSYSGWVYYKNMTGGAVWVDSVTVQEFLNNGNFELNSLSGNWDDGWVSPGTYGVETGTNQFEGNKCAFVNGHAGLEQVITGLLPNKKYTIRAYCKVTNGVSGWFGVKQYDGTNTEKYSIVTGNNYTQASVTLKTGPSNKTARVYWYNPNYTGKIWIDIVTIEYDRNTSN